MSLQWNKIIHKLAEHSRTFVCVVFMDSLASLADLVPPRSCRSVWFTMHYNLCRATNPSWHANPSTGVRCSCSSVWERGRGSDAVLVQFGVKKMAARRGDWHVSLISEAAALIGGASCQSSPSHSTPPSCQRSLPHITVTSLYGHEPPCVRKREWRMLSWIWFNFIYY